MNSGLFSRESRVPVQMHTMSAFLTVLTNKAPVGTESERLGWDPRVGKHYATEGVKRGLFLTQPPLLSEELLQQIAGFVFQNPADCYRLVIETHVAGDLKQGVAGTAFGSAAPYKTVGIRAWTIAPAHIGQGSNVTYREQSRSRHDPRVCTA